MVEAVGVTEAGLERVVHVLEELSLERDDFVIFGSGPLLAHGIRADIADLDIVARGPAWQRARELGGSRNLVRILVGGIEIEIGAQWYSPLRWTADELIDNAEIFSGYRFARLEYVREYKWALHRKKDLLDIALIDAYLIDHQSSR